MALIAGESDPPETGSPPTLERPGPVEASFARESTGTGPRRDNYPHVTTESTAHVALTAVPEPVASGQGTALAAALDLAAVGYAVAPVTLRLGPDRKKRPQYHGPWREQSTTDQAVIRDWYAQYGDTLSFLVDTGKSGVVAVDLDVKPGQDPTATWPELADGEVGRMTVRTWSGGEHHYYRARPDMPVSNSAGTIAAGVDVRGDGGHVYAPGATVWDGEVCVGAYTLATPIVPVEALSAAPRVVARSTGRERPPSTRPVGAADEWRVIGTEWLQAWTARVDRPLSESVHGVDANTALNRAAFSAARLVAAGFVSEEVATARVWDVYLTRHGWTAPDPDDVKTFRSGWASGSAHPALLCSDPRLGFTVTPAADQAFPDADAGVEPAAARAARIRYLADGMEERAEAAALVRKRARSTRRPLEDDLDWGGEEVPPPPMLVQGLIPADGVGFLYGDTGTLKSFTAVSLACSIATARFALGNVGLTVLEARKVLYIATEGGTGAKGRRRAWDTWAGLDTSSSLAILGRAVHMNDPDDVEEVRELIRRHGFGFVVVDTFHRAAAGVNENDASEFGVVFEAAASFRDEFGCGVLFTDHTAAGGNLRGTRAKGQDADYTIEAAHAPSGTTVLTTRKLKDYDTDGLSWAIRREDVPGQHFPVVVAVKTSAEDRQGPGRPRAEEWTQVTLAELPMRVQQLDGRGADCARDIWRVLATVDVGDVEGVPAATVKRLLAKGRPGRYSDTVIEKAFGLLGKLEGAELLRPARGRWAIADDYRESVQAAA